MLSGYVLAFSVMYCWELDDTVLRGALQHEWNIIIG